MVDRSHDEEDRWWRVSFTIQLTKDEEATFLTSLKGILAEEFCEDIVAKDMIPTSDPYEGVMDFKHLNQPNFDRERDGAISEIQKDLWNKALAAVELPTSISTSRRAYNEGYKQAVRDLKTQRPPLDGSDYDELIEEIDKEGT